MTAVQTVVQHAQLQTIREHAAGQAALQLTSQPQHQNYQDLPVIVQAHEQKALKSEDVIYVHRVQHPSYGNIHSIFIVCDGHQGAGAATHCAQHMPGLLHQLLPPHLPNWANMRDVVDYAEKVRRSISTAAVLLDNDWTKTDETSGTTLTLAVISGWLLTIANTGDSNAIIDMGDNVQEITNSHRIQVNKNEQNRLRLAGAQLAPLGFHLQGPAKPQEMGVGPLRMWPGGLCVSRSIGDLDAGPLIVPLPHIRQVLLTRKRALRLIMASDGLWDLMSFSKAAKTVRHKLPSQAVNTLTQMVARDRRMADDVSIIIVDMLPPTTPGATPQQFPASALQATSGKGSSSSSSSSGSSKPPRGNSSSGGLFACFKGPAVSHDPLGELPPAPPPAAAAAVGGGGGSSDLSSGPINRAWNGLEWLADVDCYEAYPLHGQQLARKSVDISRRPSPPPKQKGDYTVHGGQAHKFQQDSSWHTGNSHHGSDNLPILLTQQQLQVLQDEGPAAVAGMMLSGSGFAYAQQQQQQEEETNSPFFAVQGSPPKPPAAADAKRQPPEVAETKEALLLMMGSAIFDKNAAAAAAASLEGRVRGGSSGISSSSHNHTQQQQQGGSNDPASALHTRPTHMLPTEHYAAAAAGSSGVDDASWGNRDSRGFTQSQSAFVAHHKELTTSNSPASPAPGALLRSASAEYENDGPGVYVAGDDAGTAGKVAAPGRVIGVPETSAERAHFGSAPGLERRKGTSDQHGAAGPDSLAAAAAAADPGSDDEEGALRRLGVRSALTAPTGSSYCI